MKTIVVEGAHQGTAFHRLATIEEIGKTGRAFYLPAKKNKKEKLVSERHSWYTPRACGCTNYK